MRIYSLESKLIFDIDPNKSGENDLRCPSCSANRRHPEKKSFRWNNVKKTGFCHHCKESFVEYKPLVREKEFKVPEWKNITSLTEQAVKWFEGRMIGQDTLKKMKVYSDVEFMPQVSEKRNVICFPFFIDTRLVNIKYRDGAKNFKLCKDAELIFYNINALKDVTSIIIVEGEMDCLSYIEAGIENCISVPNGASAKNLEYLDGYIELFDKCDKIYLATDNDIKGFELREELIRRFGAEKCLVVSFKDCKDANEYLIKYGGLELRDTIKNAKEVPVSGIVDLNAQEDEIYNMFISGIESGKSVDIQILDEKVSWETGRLAVITGIPGHGKSEWLDFLIVRLNAIHGWKTGYFSPENYPVKYHYSKIASKIIGKKFKLGHMSQDEYVMAFQYIQNNFFFIFPEDDMSFETIITKAKYLVKKFGIKILVIDPYNKIEHLRERSESETEYISRFLDRLSTFARQNNVLVFLVAHPRKMDKQESGVYSKPNLYDINGSANFYNKCDYGICVYRYFNANEIDVDILKVKFKHLGTGGLVKFKYNTENGRYDTPDLTNLTINQYDTRCYLQYEIEENKYPSEPPF